MATTKQDPAVKPLETVHVVVCASCRPHDEFGVLLTHEDAALCIRALSDYTQGKCGPHRVMIYKLAPEVRG